MYTRKFNFSFDPSRVEREWTCWPWTEGNKHTWAFVHFLKRRGDKVYVKVRDDKMRVAVKRRRNSMVRMAD